MAIGRTESFTLNNAWKNIGTQAIADGYDGHMVVRELTLLNFNATVAYVHSHESGTTEPTTAADGMPISSDTAVAPSSAYTLFDADLRLVWVHTAGNQTIKYLIVGK
jgi:hypothetical protein